MADAMVTGRMEVKRKEAGNVVLANAGLNASQAIGLMYGRLIEDRNADFLLKQSAKSREDRFAAAAQFVDGLSVKRTSRFDAMTDAEIRMERLASRGLVQHA